MEMAGLILIGIGVNSFIQGLWLLLYNEQNKKIKNIEEQLTLLFKQGE
jgi:hypothetical protein